MRSSLFRLLRVVCPLRRTGRLAARRHACARVVRWAAAAAVVAVARRAHEPLAVRRVQVRLVPSTARGRLVVAAVGVGFGAHDRRVWVQTRGLASNVRHLRVGVLRAALRIEVHERRARRTIATRHERTHLLDRRRAVGRRAASAAVREERVEASHIVCALPERVVVALRCRHQVLLQGSARGEVGLERAVARAHLERHPPSPI